MSDSLAMLPQKVTDVNSAVDKGGAKSISRDRPPTIAKQQPKNYNPQANDEE